MAPEQVNKGCTVDRRADVWALGMCLHELALGKLPYDGDDDVEVIRKLMGREQPTIAPDAPPALARVLERSLALDPDARFPTAAGMQRALEGAMKELGETASSEDVAAFVRTELPDLALRRRDAVGKAIEEARERGTPAGDSRDEVAFAPTLVGDRAPERQAAAAVRADDPQTAEARAIALTKRKPGSGAAAAAPAQQVDDPRARPPSSLDQEPITIPKRSRAGLWALLVLLGAGAAGAALWPQLGGTVLGIVGASGWSGEPKRPSEPGRSPTPTPAQPTAAATPATVGPGRDLAARPTVTAATAATAPEPTAMEPGAAPAGDRALLEGPTPRAAASGVRASPAPSTSAAEAPGAQPADAASGAPATSASATAPAPPSAPAAQPAEDDPNNPYNE